MPPEMLRPAMREYRTWTADSRRLAAYRPRADDIFISTYPKCGTTWTQHIAAMLIFQSPEPHSIHDVSIWPDAPMRGPIGPVMEKLEAQTHRRFIKAHLPLDGLPLYEGVKYIHVARDGRDACMSWHNHQMAYTPEAIARLDRIGMEDDTLARPFPRVPADPAEFFRRWVTHGLDSPGLDFFDFEATYWLERRRPNLLLVHYNDLLADLAAEMRRIADFLALRIPDDLWPELVRAAGFDAMRRDGARLLPTSGEQFQGGADRFLYKGTNGRWRGVLTDDDLALYDAKVAETFTPGLAAWVEGGMRATGEPRDIAE
jgi:aryl sulfotransferase